jgi:glycosyltransferase involved in cell wall biosynthesis
MRIVINCWVLRNKQLDGIGYFTVNTFSRLIADHPEVEFILLCDKKYHEDYFVGKQVKIKRIFPPYRHPLLYVLYMELVLPFLLKRLKPDIFVSAEGFLALMSNVKQLPVIYDLNFEHFPENLSFKNRIYFRTFFKRFARKATRIATISEYSKADIVKLYGIAPNIIDNVSCGINNNFLVLKDHEKTAAKLKFADGQDYFFFVGSMHPRKNVVRLIQAFDLFIKETNAQLQLVIAGHILWSGSEIESAVKTISCKDAVKFTGRLSDDDLKTALGGAFALTFVPVFEGFGLPIVEAFQAGVPVITSQVTSLPEVAGDAAIYADPFDVDAIKHAMIKLHSMTMEERQLLINKGFKQKDMFSWQRTSELMWTSISNAVHQ